VEVCPVVVLLPLGEAEELFDVNPGKRRPGHASRFRDYVRFSFGPSLEVVERAMTRLEELVAAAG
jgi:hypothetical protein